MHRPDFYWPSYCTTAQMLQPSIINMFVDFFPTFDSVTGENLSLIMVEDGKPVEFIGC